MLHPAAATDALGLAGTIFGGVGLVLGALALHRAKKSEADARAARRDADLVEGELERTRGELTARLGRVALDAKRANGSLAIRESTTIRETHRINPDAKRILAAFHIGGCSSCTVSDDETLLHAALGSGADVEALLASLNGLAPAPAAAH